MKTLKPIKTITLCLILISIVTMSSAQNQFKTQEEAISKAKTNFIALVENGSWDFGVTAEEIRNAKVLIPINYKQVDFSALLDDKIAGSFSKISSNFVNYVVPLLLKGKVIAVVQVNKSEENWHIVGTGNPAFRTALNKLPPEMIRNGFENLKIYDIPNIVGTVYVLDLRADEKCFTEIGNFILEEAVDPNTLLEYLNKEALIFQEEFGDNLKEEKLTN